MSEERLQEIKDSVDFQYTLAKAKCIDNALLFADEEKELIEEIERLNNIIEKIRNYVYKPIDKEWGDILCIIEDGLRGSDYND